MNIIDTTYFQNELEIPQISDAAVVASVNKYIAKYEPILLTVLLGAGFVLTDAIKTGVPGTWMGLSNDLKLSPIANYVWFMYMKQQVSITTGSGEKKSENASSTNVGNWNKLVRTWNEMVDWNWELVTYVASLDVTGYAATLLQHKKRQQHGLRLVHTTFRLPKELSKITFG